MVSSTDPTRVCGVNSVWNQSVAASFGLVFPECNPGSTRGHRAGEPDPRDAAVPAPPTSTAQIDAQQANVPLGAGDMVDAADRHERHHLPVPAVPDAERSRAHRQRRPPLASRPARQLNRLADLGVKVLIATVPDIGVTPFAYAERAANADTDRAALLPG